MIILSSINCPTVICSPTVCYFSREKPLVKPTAPGSLLNIFAFAIYFSLLLFSDLYFQKPKIPCCNLFVFILSRVPAISIYPKYYKNIYPFTCEGLTTPLLRRVASICYLCAGVVYVVLLGSPTGSITLVSSLTEIPTVVMLHHPFLFGEIPT